MDNFKRLPKSIKKAVRYIRQDAPEDKLIEIKKILEFAIQDREEYINNLTKERDKGE